MLGLSLTVPGSANSPSRHEVQHDAHEVLPESVTAPISFAFDSSNLRANSCRFRVTEQLSHAIGRIPFKFLPGHCFPLDSKETNPALHYWKRRRSFSPPRDHCSLCRGKLVKNGSPIEAQ